MRIDAIVLISGFEDGYWTEGIYTADDEEGAFGQMLQQMGESDRIKPDYYSIRLERTDGRKEVLQRWDRLWSINQDATWVKAQ